MKWNVLNKRSLVGLVQAGLFSLLMLISHQAAAFEIENNGWKFTVHGNVNAYFLYSACENNAVNVVGAGYTICNGDDGTAVTNGYLPTNFQFGIETVLDGYKVAAYASYDGGLDTNEAFNNTTDDEGFRSWLTISGDDIGTLKAGRDYGVYGIDIVLADISLVGAGAHGLIKNPFNTQLGGAGFGYIFVDRLTQFTWKLPTSKDFDLQLGIFQPLNTSAFSNFGTGPAAFTVAPSLGGVETGSELPGFHYKARYNLPNGMGFISSTGLVQDNNFAGLGVSHTAYIVDVTAQLKLSDFTLTGSYFTAEGVGVSGLFVDAYDVAGTARDSDGYFIQGTYQLNKRTKIGVNYGVTNLDRTNIDPTVLLETAEKITGGVYYNLFTGVILTGEISHWEHENHAGESVENTGGNVGLTFFF